MKHEQLTSSELSKDPATVKRVFLLLDGQLDLTAFFKPDHLGEVWDSLEKYFAKPVTEDDDIDHFSIEIDIGEKATDLGWMLFHWERVFDDNGPVNKLVINDVLRGNGIIAGPGTPGPEYTPTFANGADLVIKWDSLNPVAIQAEIDKQEPIGLFDELELIPYGISA